jgi:hypothetical protein
MKAAPLRQRGFFDWGLLIVESGLRMLGGQLGSSNPKSAIKNPQSPTPLLQS